MQPQQQNNGSPEIGVAYGLALSFLRGISFTGEVFTRRPGTIGRRAHGMFVPFFALIQMGIWAYMWANEHMQTGNPSFQLGPFVLFFILWAVMSWCHIIGRGMRSRFGKYPPYSYDGTPWLKWGKADEVKIKDKLEPMMVFLIGGLIALANTPLGLWLMLTGICMGMAAGHDKWRRQEKVRELDDMMARQMEQIEDMKRWGSGRW